MYYNGEHSVTFINEDDVSKNSWTDFLLVPTSRPVVSLPEGQEFTQEIPGRNGKIDFQNYIVPQTVFKNRIGEFEFLIDHDNDNYRSWTTTKNEIVDFMHGKWLRMILEDEPDFYYEGRFYIKEWKNNSDWSTLTISYDLDPVKKSVIASTDAWKWDPFNFVTGYIHDPEDFVIRLRVDTRTKVKIIRIKEPCNVKLYVPEVSSFTYQQCQILLEYPLNNGYMVNKKLDFIDSGRRTSNSREFIIYPDYPEFYMTLQDMHSVSAATVYVVFNENGI